MININYILSVSPLSQNFITGLQNQSGKTYQMLIAGQLRQYGGLGLWRYLRKLRSQTLVIAIEDQESLLILPILLLLAIIIPCKKRLIYLFDQKFTKFSWLQALTVIFKFVLCSIGWQMARRVFDFKIKKYIKRCQALALPVVGKTVLYINENLWFGVKAGGSVGHIAGVINELQQQGYQVHYAALSDNALVDMHVNRVKLSCLKTFVYPNELNYYRLSHLNISQLRRWIKKHKPDLIYQRLSIGNYAGAVLSQEFKIPLILEYNGSEVWCFEKWGSGLKYRNLAVNAEKLNLVQASRIVTISKNLEDELINRGVLADKIICYPNCIDPQIFNPQRFTEEDISGLRKKYHLTKDHIILTFIGTFGEWHGTEILAESIKFLIDQKTEWLRQHKVHFLLIGNGSKMPVVKNILEKSVNSPFITLTGIIPQAQSPLHLAASNILLSPHIQNPDGSRFFGSPTKLFEYMAMAKGIIASDIEQVGEILRNSIRIDQLEAQPESSTHLAVLCRPGNKDDLIRAMIYMVENSHLIAPLGLNARHEVLTHYTWRHHVDQILKSACLV